MAITALTKAYTRTLQKELNQMDNISKYGTDHSAFIANDFINIPNYSGTVDIRTNPTGATAGGNLRNDAWLEYKVDHHITDPDFLLHRENMMTNYDLRASSLENFTNNINSYIGLKTAYDWGQAITVSGTSSVIETTGGAGSTNLIAGATGQRKIILLADIQAAVLKMDEWNVNANDRTLIMSSAMYYELFNDDKFANHNQAYTNSLPSGVINRILGVDVVVQPTVIAIDSDSKTLIAPSPNSSFATVDAANKSHACLLVSKSAVSKATGNAGILIEDPKPTNYGATLVSAYRYHGAKYMRSGDGYGVVIIGQGVV